MKGRIIKVLWWLFVAFWTLVLIIFVLIWHGIIGLSLIHISYKKWIAP